MGGQGRPGFEGIVPTAPGGQPQGRGRARGADPPESSSSGALNSTTNTSNVNTQKPRRPQKPPAELPVSLMGTAQRVVCEVRQAAPDPVSLPVYSSFRSVGQASWAAPAQRDVMQTIAELDERKPKQLSRFIPRLILPTRTTYLSAHKASKGPGPGQYEQRSCFNVAGATSARSLEPSTRLEHVTSTSGTMSMTPRMKCPTDATPGPGSYQPKTCMTKGTPQEVSFPVSHEGRGGWLKLGQGSTTGEVSSAKYDRPMAWNKATFNKNILQSVDNAKRAMARGF